MQAPVLVLNANVKREHGRKAQLNNIAAARAVADIIRTTLGPKSMLKMILDPMGGIVMTNDGNAILREIDVSHPAAKSMIELSRTQDEEVGDGTTSVIILAGEMLFVAKPSLEQNMHPRILVGAYIKAMDEGLAVLDKLCTTVDMTDKKVMKDIVRSSIGTKFVSRFGDLICDMAVEAVLKIAIEKDSIAYRETKESKVDEQLKGPKEHKDSKDGKLEIDIKRYARVEKIPGGFIEESKVLNGIMLNKDVVDAGMPRKIVNPRIALFDCPLEYKKGESQTNVEIRHEGDFEAMLKAEEEYVESICNAIIKVKPNLVFTEKGVSDLAAHHLGKAGIAVVRRLRGTDANRIARATGAISVNDPMSLKETDIGTGCGLFEVQKIGDEYYCYLVECKNPKACTVVLRGASKDVLNEIERNLIDAMCVVRNVVFDPRVVPGGGAAEMAIAHAISTKVFEGNDISPFRAVAQAMEVIPRTLIENCGASIIRLLTALRAKHAAGQHTWGIDGNKGELADMKDLKIWDSFLVKSQTLKTAVESACMLLRIDDIHSGMSTKEKGSGGGAPEAAGPEGGDETFGDDRDG